jgi:hypothetical protein
LVDLPSRPDRQLARRADTSGILLRLGQYEAAAHYAADSYRRSVSPISAFTIARSAAALGDRDTADGWLRVAESMASPGWITQQLRNAPELALLTDRSVIAGDWG